MKQSKEWLASCYGAYLGCNIHALCSLTGKYERGYLTGIKESTDCEIQFIIDTHADESPSYVPFDNMKLALRSLSDITDEDAIEVTNIYRLDNHTIVNKNEEQVNLKDSSNDSLVILYKDLSFKEIIRGVSVEPNYFNKEVVIDYLRSKGYDVGYREVPSLIESGIAVRIKNIIN